jgi:hypothetical protein
VDYHLYSDARAGVTYHATLVRPLVLNGRKEKYQLKVCNFMFPRPNALALRSPYIKPMLNRPSFMNQTSHHLSTPPSSGTAELALLVKSCWLRLAAASRVLVPSSKSSSKSRQARNGRTGLMGSSHSGRKTPRATFYR